MSENTLFDFSAVSVERKERDILQHIQYSNTAHYGTVRHIGSLGTDGKYPDVIQKRTFQKGRELKIAAIQCEPLITKHYKASRT